MKTIITRDIPHVIAISSQALSSSDRFLLKYVYKTSTEDFVLVDSRKDLIVVNKNLKHKKEIIDLIKQIMQSKYLPEKLFDKFLTLTDKKSDEILLKIYSDWRKARNERDLHNQALFVKRSKKPTY